MGLIAEEQPAMYKVLEAAGLTHGKGMQSYLCMIAVRLLEMRRVLKDTGSIYLHCDPTCAGGGRRSVNEPACRPWPRLSQVFDGVQVPIWFRLLLQDDIRSRGLLLSVAVASSCKSKRNRSGYRRLRVSELKYVNTQFDQGHLKAVVNVNGIGTGFLYDQTQALVGPEFSGGWKETRIKPLYYLVTCKHIAQQFKTGDQNCFYLNKKSGGRLSVQIPSASETRGIPG